MKTIILFLLALPSYAAHTPDISAVRAHENTMVVSGSVLERQDRPTPPETIMPQPAGGN